jgi:beta-glucosidase-like glycosyl hydrolase
VCAVVALRCRGRTDETPSEDPYVLGQHALHSVLGAQNGPDPNVPMIGVTLKHWIANNVEGGVGQFSRMSIDCNISEYDLASSYMPGYETPIREGNALGIMCSYNAVNGKPTCANPELLKVLREDWGFEGYITSDSDSCGCIYSPHHMAPDTQHAAALCLEGGTDINSGGTYKKNIAPGIAAGVIDIASAQAALTNAYGFRMRLGLFDPNITDKNRAIPVDAIGSAVNHLASLDAARQSQILLKNDAAKGLPFALGKRLVVIGTDPDSLAAIMEPGNYNADNICPHGGGGGGGGGVQGSGSIDTDCLKSIWHTLNGEVVSLMACLAGSTVFPCN